jgi:hypothetical protein
MSRHRAAPPRRQESLPVGRRRAETVKPRYGRVAVLGASVSVTAIAVLGGAGVLPSVASDGDGGADDLARDASASVDSVLAGAATHPSPAAQVDDGAAASPEADQELSEPEAPAGSTPEETDPAPPPDSGEGRRVVFDQSDQRVWLVDDDETVVRTYLVSGSLTDNLDPGTYSVYSRSEQAWGVDDSGTMKYFVRFTEGDAGGAIGFHDIPVDDGSLVQSVSQLGTPQSHGCIRQERKDAVALWEFAPIGTEVDVTA